jgi:hypothetical protein
VDSPISIKAAIGILEMVFRTHLKNRILVQDRGGAELSRFAGLPA